MRDKRKEYLVKLIRYPEQFNDWVVSENVRRKQINTFEISELYSFVY